MQCSGPREEGGATIGTSPEAPGTTGTTGAADVSLAGSGGGEKQETTAHRTANALTNSVRRTSKTSPRPPRYKVPRRAT